MSTRLSRFFHEPFTRPSRLRVALALGLGLSVEFGLGFGFGLSSAAARDVSNCELLSSVCVDTADRVIGGVAVSRPCWRYEKRYRCRTASPDKDRCSEEAIPDYCTKLRETCLTEGEDGCALTASDLLCTQYPSGPGITPGEPEVSVSYETTTKPALPPLGGSDGCFIASRKCLDDRPRDVPVENWPGNSVTVDSPAPANCWATEIRVSCPSAEEATACEKLEAAGGRQKTEKTCEATDADGNCIRWSATYACRGSGIEGDDIVNDGEIEVPDGGIIEDKSECDAKLLQAAKDGLACTEKARVCTKPGRTEIIDGVPVEIPCAEWTVEYACRGEGKNGCAALESLADSGVCRLEGKLVCEETDDTGTCIRSSAVYRCGGDAANPPPDDPGDAGDAELIDKVEEIEAVPVDTCEPFRENDRCVETEKTCVEGPGIRMIDGEPVYKDCWAWSHTYTCAGDETATGNECGKFETDPDCELLEEKCVEGDKECKRPVRVYKCKKSDGETFVGEACEGEACIAGVCTPTDDAPDEDFAEAVVDMEIGREASIYGDIAGDHFFSGEHLTCRDRKGAASCCRSDAVPGMSNSTFSLWLDFGASAGWEAIKYVGSPYVYDILNYSDRTSWLLTKLYGQAGNGIYSPSFSFWGVTASYSAESGLSFNFSPGGFALAAAMHFYQNWRTCRAEDQKVAMAKGERLCRYIGTTCEKRVSGLGCVESAQHYVCFNSRLARIINEEGRRQLGRGWGSPEAPDARGFTLEEMQILDFSKMDLTEFVADVVKEAAGNAESAAIDAEAELARAQKRLEEMLAGKLGIHSPVEGATGKHAGETPTSPTTPVIPANAGFMCDPIEHPTWGPYCR